MKMFEALLRQAILTLRETEPQGKAYKEVQTYGFAIPAESVELDYDKEGRPTAYTFHDEKGDITAILPFDLIVSVIELEKETNDNQPS